MSSSPEWLLEVLALPLSSRTKLVSYVEKSLECPPDVLRRWRLLEGDSWSTAAGAFTWCDG